MRFNTLYRGSATEAAAELDGGDNTQQATPRELQVALINALQCIARLERQVDALEHARDCAVGSTNDAELPAFLRPQAR